MDADRRKFLILSGAAPAALAGAQSASAAPAVQVTELGARGDGRTDDTAAIQRALDAHSRVFLPAGRFRITRPLRFRSNQEIIGETKGGLGGRTKILADGGFAAFEAAAKGRAATEHTVFRNLTVQNGAEPPPASFAAIAPGSIGIDLDDTSHAVIEKCAFRYHERGVRISGSRAGYYHSLLDNEYASCTTGIAMGGGGGGNSNRIIGGRIFSCRTGIAADVCNENFISLAIENCELGLELGPRTQGFDVTSRFEGCGDSVGGGDVLPSTRGAAVLIARGGWNHHIRGTFSNAGDRIIDLDGRNFIEVAKYGYSGVHQQSVSNLFWNEALSVDSNGDGLADGLSVTGAVQMAIGPSGQRVRGSRRGPVVRVEPFRTTPGQPYVFSVRCRTNANGAWSLRGSAEGYSGTDLTNFPLSLVGEWGVVTAPFLAPGTSAHFYFTQLGGASELQIGGIWFGPGSVAPPFGLRTPRETMPTFPDNLSALRAGLPRGTQYATPTGEVRVVV